jgi:hypothetical protein
VRIANVDLLARAGRPLRQAGRDDTPLKRSALVPMLLYAQDEIGYVSDAVVPKSPSASASLELDVRNVLSYYSMLRTKPAASTTCRSAPTSPACCAAATRSLDHCKRSSASATKASRRRPLLARRSRVHRRLLLGSRHAGQLRLPRRPHQRQGRRRPEDYRDGRERT